MGNEESDGCRRRGWGFIAGDCFTLRAGVRAVVLPLRRGRFVPAAGFPDVLGSLLRSMGEAVVLVNAAWASIAGEVRGLKNSSASP